MPELINDHLAQELYNMFLKLEMIDEAVILLKDSGYRSLFELPKNKAEMWLKSLKNKAKRY